MKTSLTQISRVVAALAATSLSLIPSARAADAKPLLVAGPVVTIPDSAGKFDFLSIDPVHHRLLAAHEKDETADFIDLDKNTLITRLKLGPVVHVVFDEKSDRYYCSVQDDKTVTVLNAKDLKEIASVKLDGETDALLLVPSHGRIYAAHDNGTHLFAIDTATNQVAGAVDIPGAPEIMVYDSAADRIYLNIKTANEVVVIDPASNKIVGHWATTPAVSPHGMVLDAKRNRAYVAGGNGILAAIDTKTGKVVGSTEIAKNVDQAAFDARHNRVYCAGEKELSVVEVSDAGLKTLGSVPTNKTARNVAVDEKNGNVWTTYTDGKNSYAQSWTRK